MAERIVVHEVGPRDGLQNEAAVLPTDVKVALIERLVAAGVRDLEVTSFVRPRWIPQLADASEVVRRLPRVEGLTCWALVPNRRGLERALESGIGAIATFMSVSETHNRKNVNRTVRESLVGLEDVIRSAVAEGLRVRSYLSTVFGCPYEGRIPPERSVELARAFLEMGAERVALGDTVGLATPRDVQEVLDAMEAGGVSVDRLALHMHDTRGTALANVLVGLQRGVRVFDASVAGLGGCPYAPGASGNLATEDLVYMLHGMGYDTGIDLERLAEAGAFVGECLGRTLPGRYHQAYLAGRRRSSCTA